MRLGISITKRGIKAAKTWISYQWPGIGALCIGFGFLGVTLTVNHFDAPATENINPETVPKFGIYADEIGLDAFIDYPPGAEGAFERWSVRAIPGDPWVVTVNWHASDSGFFPLNVSESKSIFIQLPPEARMVNGVRMLDVPDNACAAWRSEKGNGTATPEIIISASNVPWVVCTIPAVGQVQSLVTEMSFEWHSQARSSSGIGRFRDAISFPSYPRNTPNFAQQLSHSAQIPTLALLQPLTFTIESSPLQRAVDMFPEPNSGGIGERSWEFSFRDQSQELEFTSQSESDRLWIKPTTDTALLLGGAALGLVTAFWRKGKLGTIMPESEESRAQRADK